MTVVERLKQVERQNRKLRNVIALLVILTASTILLGAAMQSGKTLSAQTFVVQDKNGNVRATLGLDRDNEAILTFFDTSGKKRMALGFSQKQGPMLAGYTSKGKSGGGLLRGSDPRIVKSQARAVFKEDRDKNVAALRAAFRRIVPSGIR